MTAAPRLWRRAVVVLFAVAAGTNVPTPLLLVYRDELGMRWLKFHEDHEDAEGLSGDTVDPEAYVEEHS